MVPCLHQGNIYIQRKLRVWREQKCIPVVGGETPLTCAGRQTTRLMGDGIGPRAETCVNWVGPITTVPCLHQGNVYIKRKLRVCRAQKCIPQVGAETLLTCACRQTTPSHVGRYRAENGNLSKLGWTCRHGTVFAPRQCLYQNKAADMCLHQGNIYIQRKLRVWREQKCIPLVGAETPLTCAGQQTTPCHGGRKRADNGNCVNWGGPIAMVPCSLKGNVYIKTKQWVCRAQKCIPLVGAETPFTCAGRQTTLSHGGRYRVDNRNLRKWWGDLSPCYHVCTKAMSISKGSYGYGEIRNVFH